MEKVPCPIPRQLRGQLTEGLGLAALSTVSSETLKNVKGTKMLLLRQIQPWVGSIDGSGSLSLNVKDRKKFKHFCGL